MNGGKGLKIGQLLLRETLITEHEFKKALLIQKNQKIYKPFGEICVEKKFLTKAIDLSPIKMSIKNGDRIYSFPELRKGRNETEDTFKGLPGLLSDALPDKYGNKLINTWLAQQGRPENSMNPLEKLCFIGTRGIGALEFDPAQIKTGKNSFSIELDSLVEVAGIKM